MLENNLAGQFWRGYGLIEEALSYSKQEFEESKTIRYRTVEGIRMCLNALDEAIKEKCRTVGINAIGEFNSRIIALEQRGIIMPQLVSDILDIKKQVQVNLRKKDWKALYSMLVRIMEVLEAGFVSVYEAHRS